MKRKRIDREDNINSMKALNGRLMDRLSLANALCEKQARTMRWQETKITNLEKKLKRKGLIWRLFSKTKS